LNNDPTALDGGSYGRMIDDLAGVHPSGPANAHPADDSHESAVTAASGSFQPMAPEAPEFDTPVERQELRLSAAEVGLFRNLGVIAARSPRAVKRMINIYRLMRVSSVTFRNRLLLVGPLGERVPADFVQFALACEAGLDAAQMEKLAGFVMIIADDAWQRWREQLAADAEAELPALSMLLSGALTRAVSIALSRAGGAVHSLQDLQAAFQLAARYSFRIPKS
jgi:hypothetical protein